MNWRFCVTDTQRRALAHCYGSMDEGDGYGDGYGSGYGDCDGGGYGDGCVDDGGGYGDVAGGGYGSGYGDGGAGDRIVSLLTA